MTDKSNDDCYFYYYSTCQKGDLCQYRHEPSALGCETVCQDWKNKRCVKPGCNLRHMILKKNRQEIACYWETQPSGCQKPHCAFRHSLPRHTMIRLRNDLMKGLKVEATRFGNNNSEMRSHHNNSNQFTAYGHVGTISYPNN